MKILKLKNNISKATINSCPSNLILFFEDEWENKPHICESMLRAKTNQIDIKIPARNCSVKMLDTAEAKSFFTKNHISGYVNSRYVLGLEYDDEVVSAIAFRKPFASKDEDTIEISRFCSALDTIVIGGLSKLLHHSKTFLKAEGFQHILTYADLRFGEGKSYTRVGFEHTGKTQQDYFYTDGERRFHRFKFRARYGKSEKEIATAASVWKIYGKGSNIYKMTL